MARADKKNKKIAQSKKCVRCGIYISVCPLNTKLTKSEDFDSDSTELSIRILDGVTIINDEICIYYGAPNHSESRICNRISES